MQASSKSNTLPKAKLRLRYFTPREVGAFLLHLLLFSPAPCLNRMLVLLFHSYNCSFLSLQVANLHSFPEDFHFPQDVRLRQWYVSFKTLIWDTSYFIIHSVSHLFLQLCIAWEQFKRRSGCTIIQLSFYSFIVLQQLGRKTTSKTANDYFPPTFLAKNEILLIQNLILSILNKDFAAQFIVGSE